MITDGLTAKTEILDAEDAIEVDEIRGELEFSNLTFKHQGASEDVLKDINLHIPAGTTLAIIGRTGNGKSTLVNLLLRLYKTESDMIKIDGHDIGKLRLKILRENIAYVPQDNFLFSDTLKSNIAFGVKGQDINAVIKAAEAVCIFQEAVRILFSKKRVIAVTRKQEIPFLQELRGQEDAFVVDVDELHKKVGCVIIASGLGIRFGENKLLAKFKNKMLIEHILECTKDLFAKRVVVTRTKEVQAFCEQNNISVIYHEYPYRSDVVRLVK